MKMKGYEGTDSEPVCGHKKQTGSAHAVPERKEKAHVVSHLSVHSPHFCHHGNRPVARW